LSKFSGLSSPVIPAISFAPSRQELERNPVKYDKGNRQYLAQEALHLTASTSHLIAPHGGELINLIPQPEKLAELKAYSKEWPSWDLTGRQICDLELLITGGFSPLQGFMTRADYESVCQNMKLASGVIWPMPITLDVTEEFAKKLTAGTSKVALRDAEGVMVAVLHVEDIWQPDRTAEAKAVFGSTSKAHPGADYAMNKSNPWYIGGKI
jgi:sulfate adenylyltransferase